MTRAQFKMGGGTPTEEQEEARGIDRLAREYDEQIAAMGRRARA
jgi:hypothetical protein